MKKRALSFFLAVLFLLGVCPAVLADGEEPVFRLTHVTETTEDGVNEYAFTYEGDGMFPTQVVCSGVDGDGTITAQYDPDGRITSLTSTGVYSYFGSTTASFNDRGDPVYIRYAREETYGDSQTQAYTYDDEGRLTSVGVAYTEYGAPGGQTLLTLTYDGDRIAGIREEQLNTVYGAYAATFSLNESGHMVKAQRRSVWSDGEGGSDASRTIIDYYYNDNGDLTQRVTADYEGDQPNNGTYSHRYHDYEYDGEGRVTYDREYEDDPDYQATTTSYEYDQDGNVTYSYADYGWYTSEYYYSYDAAGRQVSMSRWDDDGYSYSARFAYDEDGRKHTVSETTGTYDGAYYTTVYGPQLRVEESSDHVSVEMIAQERTVMDLSEMEDLTYLESYMTYNYQNFGYWSLYSLDMGGEVTHDEYGNLTSASSPDGSLVFTYEKVG